MDEKYDAQMGKRVELRQVSGMGAEMASVQGLCQIATRIPKLVSLTFRLAR